MQTIPLLTKAQNICEKHNTIETKLWCFYVKNFVNNEYNVNDWYYLCDICIDKIFLNMNVKHYAKVHYGFKDIERKCDKCHMKNLKNSIWIYSLQIYYSDIKVEIGSVFNFYFCDKCNENEIYHKIFTKN